MNYNRKHFDKNARIKRKKLIQVLKLVNFRISYKDFI